MWAEELTRPYGTGAADRRPSLQASRLLLQSEGSLKLENFSEAVRLAEQSLSAFRQFGDTRGQADAARLLSVAMIHQDRRKEADRLLKDELAVFQTSANSGSKSAEARLLLALADVNSDRRGQKKREEALRFVGQARTLSLDEADVGLQASSLAVMAKIFIKYKGDPKACNKEALRLGTQALQLYEQSDDSRGRAISSHHCAIAQGNLGEIAASLQYINDSASFWRKAQDLIMEANAQLMMGGLLLKGGTARQAVSAAESALASYRNCHVTGSRELRAVQLAVRAHIGNGEPWRAIWTAEDAVARYRERRDRPNEAQALLSLASGYTFSPSGREEQEDSQRHFEDPTFCPGEAGWHCWFQHITWCKPKGDVLKIYGFPEHGGFKGKDVPEVFHPLLKCSPVKPRFWFYWWRAQSIAYLIRFNEKTRSALDQLRSETLFQCKEHVKAKLLEPGTVSAHVRHGFKLWEAKIFDFEDYVEQMDALAAGNQNLRILYKEVAESNTSFSFPSDAFLRRAVFLSTEDPLVVLEALKLCAAKDPWKVIYTKADRNNKDSWMHVEKRGAARREVMLAMMNLELALEADAWVCTLTSNWCRLIDELRMTIALKASHPYLSLSKVVKTCKSRLGLPKPECYLDY